jgi:hypothetical protein
MYASIMSQEVCNPIKPIMSHARSCPSYLPKQRFLSVSSLLSHVGARVGLRALVVLRGMRALDFVPCQ